jgi:hypothetical protein
LENNRSGAGIAGFPCPLDMSPYKSTLESANTCLATTRWAAHPIGYQRRLNGFWSGAMIWLVALDQNAVMRLLITIEF